MTESEKTPYTLALMINPGVAPEVFQRGADFSDEGAKYSFRVLIMPKSSEKIAFHL